MFFRRLSAVMFVVILVLVIVILVIGRKGGPITLAGTVTKETVSVSTMVREILSIAEFSSLEVRFTERRSRREHKFITFGDKISLPVPGSQSVFGEMMDVTVKLGIDINELGVDTTRSDTIFITLPPIKILSYETHPEGADTYAERGGALNSIRVSAVRRLEAQEKARLKSLVITDRRYVAQARENTESVFGKLLRIHPELRAIPVVYIWKEPPHAAAEFGKGDLVIEGLRNTVGADVP